MPDQPHSELHPEYEPGCPECFEEAYTEGFRDFEDAAPGVRIVAIQQVKPGHIAVGNAVLGEDGYYLFSVTYGAGYGVGIAPASEEIIEGFIALTEKILNEAPDHDVPEARKAFTLAEGLRGALNFPVIR